MKYQLKMPKYNRIKYFELAVQSQFFFDKLKISVSGQFQSFDIRNRFEWLLNILIILSSFLITLDSQFNLLCQVFSISFPKGTTSFRLFLVFFQKSVVSFIFPIRKWKFLHFSWKIYPFKHKNHKIYLIFTKIFI